MIGIALIALGMNKQMDLQVTIIKTGRRLAEATGIYQHRLVIHRLFFTALCFMLFVFLQRFRRQINEFRRTFPVGSFGLVLVAGYSILRAATIEHMDRLIGFDLEKVPALWLLEIGGIMFIGIQAVRVGKFEQEGNP